MCIQTALPAEKAKQRTSEIHAKEKEKLPAADPQLTGSPRQVMHPAAKSCLARQRQAPSDPTAMGHGGKKAHLCAVSPIPLLPHHPSDRRALSLSGILPSGIACKPRAVYVSIQSTKDGYKAKEEDLPGDGHIPA